MSACRAKILTLMCCMSLRSGARCQVPGARLDERPSGYPSGHRPAWHLAPGTWHAAEGGLTGHHPAIGAVAGFEEELGFLDQPVGRLVIVAVAVRPHQLVGAEEV